MGEIPNKLLKYWYLNIFVLYIYISCWGSPKLDILILNYNHAWALFLEDFEKNDFIYLFLFYYIYYNMIVLEVFSNLLYFLWYQIRIYLLKRQYEFK